MITSSKKNEASELTIREKYLDALSRLDGYVTVSDWARKVAEIFPELLEKADREAKNHKSPSTGMKELKARISSGIATGVYAGKIDIHPSEQPKKVRFLHFEEIRKQEVEEKQDFTRDEIIEADLEQLTPHEQYRISEMTAIISQLRGLFKLDFEFEHAKAILNPNDRGRHHPDNIQILLKVHNNRKSKSNWRRFTFSEQVEYINAVVAVQKLMATRLEIQLSDEVIKSLIARLKLVY